ncbi:MAG: hypothetical protein H6828_05585 [Planctomycetes bacterium]|nr:hypothetical protein [Planctomycetota bacterium]
MNQLTRTTRGVLAVLALAASAAAQCPEQTLQGFDTLQNDSFGRVVATTSSRALIGAPADDDLGFDAGTAWVYRAQGGQLVHETKLLAGQIDAGDHFGSSVALSDDFAVVGAPDGDGFAPGSGVVVVFQRSGNVWSVRDYLTPNEGVAGDRFGHSVAIDGTRIVVGAPSAQTTPSAPNGGAVYVFDLIGTNWTYSAKVVPNDVFNTPSYGHAVDVLDDRIVVGTPGDDNGGNNAGAAYVFDRVGGNWLANIKLIATDFSPNAAFGWDVALGVKEVMVGAPIAQNSGVGSGAAYFFNEFSGSWVQSDKLFDPSGASVDRYGFAVDYDGDRALVGMPFRQQGGVDYGRTWVCDRVGGAWVPQYWLESPSGGVNLQRFGVSVAMQGTVAVVGDNASLENYVHVFQTSGVDCNNNGVPDTCDIALGISSDLNANGLPDECDGTAWDSVCSSGANSTGAPAVMGATGSTSVGGNNLQLSASPVPNQPGIFYYGPGQAAVPFGNGIRCVSAPFQRLAITVATGNTLSYGLDVNNPPTMAGAINAGSTWYFQAWFRDPQAGGAGFDLSDALKITFVP